MVTRDGDVPVSELAPERRRKLDKSDPNLAFIFTPELEKVADIFCRYDYELRVAGGAVRDILMGKRPNDVDFATTATPEEMTAMFEAEGVRMIHDKGAEHGTVTVRIDDKENFEITTLRIDVETDGRHAEVEFTRDWRLDANRRDLTVNAMFLTLDGELVDFFNGERDLEQRRIAFVGEPGERIREDFLRINMVDRLPSPKSDSHSRILRYFRFFGRLSFPFSTHESATLDAISAKRQGLSQISGERIWDELQKILRNSPSNGEILPVMHRLGLLSFCGFRDDLTDDDLNYYQETCRRCADVVAASASVGSADASLRPLPITLLADLIKTESDVTAIVDRLKISRAEKNLALFLVQWRQFAVESASVKSFKDLLVDRQKDANVKEHVIELLKYKGDSTLLTAISCWTAPRLPVTGFDLIKAGVEKGKRMTFVLTQLTKLWKESDYSMTKDELVEAIPNL